DCWPRVAFGSPRWSALSLGWVRRRGRQCGSYGYEGAYAGAFAKRYCRPRQGIRLRVPIVGNLRDGLAAVYDYGPNGVELKNNLKRLWWEAMTQLHGNVVGIDAAIFMEPRTWEASGHVAGFNDPLIDNLDSKKRYRADVLIEEKAAEYEKAGDPARGAALTAELGRLLTANDLAGVKQLIIDEKIVDPLSGSGKWTDMEMQFFVRPGTEGEWYDTWKAARRRFHEAIGLPAEKLRFHDHDKLAHYAKAAVDIEFEFPFGFKEIEGIHSRSDFDLTQHQNLSRKKQQYFDNDIDEATGKPYGNY
nr:hypothetical protein [Tanacetum cinerariifolium]